MKKLAMIALCALALVAVTGVTASHATTKADATANIYDPDPA